MLKPAAPLPEAFLSPRGSRTPLWGPPADDSIWQPWSRREGAQFAPKQRNIISAKAISTLSETSQSHPPFECKGLAHSSAERGRERKRTAKEKAWGGRGGHTVTDTLAFPSERLSQRNESAQQRPTELSLMRACVCKTQKRACARQSPRFPPSPLLFLFKSNQGLL